MEYIKTRAVDKILGAKKRLKIIQGGSSAGKTIAILLIFIDRAQNEQGKVFSVVSETLPHLKRGAIRDFLNIMEVHGYYREQQWNRTDYIYTFETGCKIEFFSADNAEKVRGPRRNVLFINEANNIGYETYTQLAIRTSEEIYLDYNPVAQFWAHEEILDKDPERTTHDFLILTYKDNDALPETIVREIESRMDRKEWFKVYGLGQLGGGEGLVYPNWRIIDEVPENARLERHYVDFGYTNDPTAIGSVYYHDGGYILDEVAYNKGLSNKQIADIITNLDRALTVADSAEPKSIDEIRSYGVNIMPAVKGRDSVNQGIQVVQDQRISVTKRSTNILKEMRNYMFVKDENDNFTNEPIGIWNHHMDGIRYAMTSIVPIINRRDFIDRIGRRPKVVRKNPAR